ncbi:MAG: SDR family NAD(P)-dependent oxidoreductase [Candidatus Melainabacteria bacterium]|nr:SDR family NAD(P)-dependent oxidoreductase [Candidatus Melainabacteria bacterium]
MKNKKSALITGSAKRIGKEIALFLANEGFDIALHYNTSQKEAKTTQKKIKEMGKECKLFKCNLNNINEVLKLIPKVKKSFPDLFLLINNASVFKNGDFLETNPKLLEEHFNVNFKAPFFLSRDFAKHFKKGQIINILDTKVARNYSKHFSYTLSKKALYEFTKMSAKELAPNIRVNAIAPGPTLPGKSDDYSKHKLEVVSKKYIGTVQFITQGIKYLINNDLVVGECLFIDGGIHL